jgi:oligopeptide transport system substrate-binding protein
MAQAGYGPERPLILTIRYNTGEIHERIAVAVGALWQEHLGVRTELVREEFRVLLDKVRAGEAQVWRASWIADYDDARSFLTVLAGDSPVNGTGWSNPEYDRLLADAAHATDARSRSRLLAAAEARMLAEAPVMPLYFYVSKMLVKPWVRGVVDNPLNVHPSRFIRVCREAAPGC